MPTAKRKVSAKPKKSTVSEIRITPAAAVRLTQKVEAEILNTYHTIWDAVLKGDMKTFATYLDSHVTIYGSAEGEIFNSKKAAAKFYEATADEMTGKVDLRKRRIGIKMIGNAAIINEECDLYVLTGKDWTFYGHARISEVLEQDGKTWKISHHHTSFPDHRTEEGQQLAVEKIKAENIQLREAVKRRTVELEHKNRELAIEAAMEKVRARSLAMQKPEELVEVAEVLRKEIGALGVEELETSSIYIINEITGTTECWYAIKGVRGKNKNLVTDHMTLRLEETWVGREMKKFYRSKETRTSILMQGKNRKEWINYCAEKSSVLQGYYEGEIPERTYHLIKFSNGFMGAASPGEISQESWGLLQRATSVFSFAYKRFSDLQQAEAQAREAKIEAALERIRARALAMHRSDELTDVSKVLREQMGLIGQRELETSAVHLYDEDEGYILSWRAFRISSDLEGAITYGFFKIPKNSCEIATEFIKKFKSKASDYTIEVSGDKQREWYKILFKLAPEVNAAMKKSGSTKEKRYYHFSKFSGGALLMVSSKEPSYDSIELQKRSAQVFDLAYRRFKDLQKAEAQAREAQIEAALERVRSRSLAMQKSDELKDVVAVLYQKFQELEFGIDKGAALVMTFLPDSNDHTQWITDAMQSYAVPFFIPFTKHSISLDQINARKEGLPFFSMLYDKKEKNEYFKYLFQHTEYKLLPKPVKQLILSSKNFGISIAFEKNSAIAIPSTIGKLVSDDDVTILKRFARVFEQSYTRFLDLQKAEAQAREAEIELALERVRAKTMAMHHTEELKEVIQVVFEQFVGLNINVEHAGFILDYKEREDMHIWLATLQQGVPSEICIPYFDSPHWNSYREAKARQDSFFANLLPFKVKNKFYRDLFKWIPSLTEEAMQAIFSKPALSISTVLLENVGLYIEHYSETPFTDDENNVLMRFGKVFQQTYTRFLDLQKAEAQAREAEIQLALERVRARSLAMHHTKELQDVVNIVAQQLHGIGMDINGGVFIAINSEVNTNFSIWASGGMADYASKVNVPPLNKPIFTKLRNAIKTGNSFLIETFSDKEKRELFTHLFKYAPWSNLSNERKKELMSREGGFARSVVISQYTSISITNHHGKPFNENENNVLKRFGNVFEQSYIRFLDLQKAEAQAREAQIETALERVRARTMAMHKSEELTQTAAVLFNEFEKLGVGEVLQVTIGIYNEANRTIEFSATDWELGGANLGKTVALSIDEPNLLKPLTTAWKTGKPSFVIELTEKKLEGWLSYRNSMTGSRATSKATKGRRVITAAFFSKGHLAISSPEPKSATVIALLERFAAVFNQTYTRFLDLQKAEAQAREAQIEAALERVRAKTMAMHSSEDVSSAIATLFSELDRQRIENVRCGIAIIDVNKTMDVWSVTNLEESRPDKSPGKMVKASGTLDMNAHKLWQLMYDAWRSKTGYLYYYLSGKDKQKYIDLINTAPGYLSQPLQELPDMHCQFYFFNEGAIWAYSLQPHTEQQQPVMKRFTSVFSQTYLRYRDLQKAEAQAREAQIEAALERVRAQAMAMHHTEDLGKTIKIYYEQLDDLIDSTIVRCGAGLLNKENTIAEMSSASRSPEGETFQVKGMIDMRGHPLLDNTYDHWLKQEEYHHVLRGNEIKEYYQYITNQVAIPENRGADELYFYFPMFAEGSFYVVTSKAVPEEELQIFRRFSSVLSLTYRRFNDLQKAEANAREATIEAALEKVRGKAMAMHNSNDLIATAGVLFAEMRKLGINTFRCGVGLLTKQNRNVRLYSATTTQGTDNLPVVGSALLDGHEVLAGAYDAWVHNTDYFPVLKGELLRTYYEKINSTFTVPVEQTEQYEQHGFFLPFSEGLFYGYAEQPITEGEKKILHRFNAIVDLTFRRYIELQKSEEVAREAVRSASLDRVRAEIASMRTVQDLERITPLIWKELTTLGIPFVRCGVFIMDEQEQLIHTFLSTPEGKAIAAFHLPYSSSPFFDAIEEWRAKKIHITHWDTEGFAALAESLVKERQIATPEQYLRTVPKEGLYLHYVPFLQGILYVGNTVQLTDDHLHLIQSVADTFSTAYARYEDFNKLEAAKTQMENTLKELRAAQNQLVQSEKMASLGELTAGIAHEIQNPLNFVNNFSEVSNELIKEIQDIRRKTQDTSSNKEENELLNDIAGNLEKISHHGKRAADIVKGMLQHSRSSTGVKESTDINALVDEYLRLAYHGLRAKDKSFNAKFETNLDPSLPKVSVIPQDIGRVVLNLINNAFYAVSEKSYYAKASEDTYEPSVTVTTKKLIDKIEISVKDNGNGIPDSIKEKIFQPFFTTKPTGQGTGLGLSLSYDIVKAHGGELKVETKEEDGSKFIIQLPIA
ncbi:MAG: nuclear transport factor 2 family protein [Cyclobacteriaceae bacterium]|nr:nuclear transport factor 2 family protein [Cyclobacteriaceae bacterium]